LPGSLTAERTPRELRLSAAAPKLAATVKSPETSLAVPGEATAFGLNFRAESPAPQPAAVIRNWKAGDRVTLRHSSGPRKIKEVLERLKVTGSARAEWPVVEWQGQVVWMQGAELQPVAGITVRAISSHLQADRA
jgi:tRNA(Ile)-lysidine synthase